MSEAQPMNHDAREPDQFLTEVFPTELREITRRRKSALGDLRKPFTPVIEDAAEAEKKLREAEQKAEESKKGESIFIRCIPGAVVGLALPPEDKLRDSEKEAEQLRTGKFRFAQWIPESLETAREKARRIRPVREKRREGIRNRDERKKEFDDKKTLQALAVGPSTKHGLIGLAFSGGGIRSATFNLGVIQALAKHRILKHVDYLSTVSGGGFIGSCLSSVLNNKTVNICGDQFPLHHLTGPQESRAVNHLRNSGNYVAPGGVLDMLRIPALLLRGILINLLVIFPYIVLTVWATDQLYRVILIDLVQTSRFPWKFYFPREFYVLTPLVATAFVLLVGSFPILYPRWAGKWSYRDWYEGSFAGCLLLLIAIAVLESLPTALYYYHGFLTKEWLSISGDTLTWLTTIGSVISFVTAGQAAGSASKWTGKLTLFILGLLGPLIILLIYLRLGAWIVLKVQLFGWESPDRWWIMAVALTIYTYTRRYVDVNSISLHGFYRDRLSKAYLFQNDPQGVKANDEQKLSRLSGERVHAPYHLINAALNLQGSEDPNLRGRNADFFIFSKHYTGSNRTGFYPTKELEEKDPHLDLGTAMAISGAAAAPNMGTTTIKPLVFIMTLLNIRLGYWLPNPYRLLRKAWYTGPFWGVGPFYLLLELFSWLNEKSRYVNLSDGGHIENLGVYELLRRRCKIIIVGDGEADPTLTFGSLATVMRYAQIDLGIEIDIELNDIRKHSNGLSRKHCAVGKIRYPDGETGYLLYIKSSVTGEEVEYIREYRSQHPEFPHESTADQFFDEAQFETYRALGFHIVDEVLRENEGETLDGRIEKMEVSLRPRFQMEGEFVNLQEQLSELETKFLDASVAEYTYQIYPELLADVGATAKTEKPTSLGSDTSHPSSPTSPSVDQVEKDERFRKIFHLCNLQMQLMENVYMALQLDNPENLDHYVNRGWINLFRRWTQAEYFRRAWVISIGTYGVGFQTFCEQAWLD